MRVITFSTKYPVSHPRKGEDTFFVEKVVKGLHRIGIKPFDVNAPFIEEMYYIVEPKFHTIRAGTRWKVGDFFSPRIWSGKPYASKQIEFAPHIQIKKIDNFQAVEELFYLNGKQFDVTSSDLPINDGLSTDDFLAWFDSHPKKNESAHFAGQILHWNENINY